MWQAAGIDNLNVGSFKYKDPGGLGPREITDRGHGIAKTEKVLGSFPMTQEQEIMPVSLYEVSHYCGPISVLPFHRKCSKYVYVCSKEKTSHRFITFLKR